MYINIHSFLDKNEYIKFKMNLNVKNLNNEFIYKILRSQIFI